uniref:uncharacterized protein n=1 Tax=Centroberyx gerrardi TaxID=166262 RepID=UPI003AABC15E
MVPVPSGGIPAGGSTAKHSFRCGRSSSAGGSVSSRGVDRSATGSSAGGGVSRGSTSLQGSRQTSRPARLAVRRCSSQSSPSLHTSSLSLSAAPFMRSCRSLSRLDQSPIRDETGSEHAVPRSQVKTGHSSSVKTVLDSSHLSCPAATEEPSRAKKDQSDGDNADKMETSFSSEPPASSSSVVSSAACHHHSNKLKKQTKDGVYTLCAMTSGIRRNWVQAVLKNVRPTLTPDVASSLPEQRTRLKSQKPDSQSAEVVGNAAHQKSRVPERCREGRYKTFDWSKVTPQQQKEQEPELQLEREQGRADGSSASLPVASSCVSSPISSAASSTSSSRFLRDSPHRAEEGQESGSVTDASSGVATSQSEGAESDSSTSTLVPPNDEGHDEHSNVRVEIEQRWQQVETTPLREERQVSISTTCECMKDGKTKEKLSHQQMGQLVKELEQTQKELSRLQQLNRNLQDQLRQHRENHSRGGNGLLSTSNSSSAQALALERLQKINHDLRFELEAQRKSQEEAREAELRRRVDLLAQQAQLLVTGDATALAQAHLEQDRRLFREQQVEWERCVASLRSKLSISEEQRREAESCLMQLQQECQGYPGLQQEANRLREHLQDVTAQLCANEEAQAQKEVRLQKHLVLLQESQDRERRSLASSLAQAEQHSQDLQERLERAEQQVDSLNKSQSWTREIEEAQQQLQEELACTVSAVQRLQEEREQLNRRCQELQNQLAEADGEVSRLQNRLKTDETHYYNLEHSYERACEELQLALGQVQGREAETQDIREGYERLLDGKEQELSDVLVKMEVLGNSLEETEVKLAEVLKVCTCASSQLENESSDDQSSDISNAIDVAQQNGNHSYAEHARTRSHSIDPSYQYIVTAGDDPDRFMSVIKLLETKLYVTEEKLRDITQRLEDHQSHMTCQDPHLCSELTQSRATAQHLSLLLHSQAKQSQRFAKETENRSRVLVDRFQAALSIVEGCRKRLQAKNQGGSSAAADITEFEKQLATAAACLQQGEKDAEKQQHKSHYACKVEDKMISDETLPGAKSAKSRFTKMLPSEDSIGRTLMREVLVVEKMVSVLQSQHDIGQLHLISGDEGDVAHRYKSIMSQRIALEMEKGTQLGKAEGDNTESLESAIGRVCAEAELIYTALKFQRKYESMTQGDLQVNNQEVERSLADINPPELAPYEEQVQVEGRGMEEAAKPLDRDQSVTNKVEKQPDWLERLISRLQRRAKALHQLRQEISDGNGPDNESSVDHNCVNDSAIDLTWVKEQAKLIYLSDRLYLDLELELQQSKMVHDRLQALCKEQDITLNDEQEAFNHTLCELQEDNSVLREQLECAEQKIISAESGNQRLLEDIQKIEDYHEERMQKLEKEFQAKIRELQQIHEQEMKHLHNYYAKTACISKDKQTKSPMEGPSPTDTKEQGNRMGEGDAVAMREAYQRDFEKLKASCDQGFTAMEEMHRKLVSDLQQQHQREAAALLKEKDQLLKEETAATMAAIVAMRKVHKEELERSQWSQHIRETDDITQLHTEYEKEIQLLHQELEVLSVQHTEKCLENSQMSQELQAERQTSLQYQRENQELKSKQEMTQKVTEEISHLRSSLNGKQSNVTSQAKDLYEMEVILRVKDAEMQFLRQEALSLKEELKTARMDKMYAQNKLKALYANSQDEPQHDAAKLCEDFKYATWSPKDHSRDDPTSGHQHEDIVTNKSDAVFMKKTDRRTSLTRQIRVVRSKSLKEGLSMQERMKLFESF